MEISITKLVDEGWKLYLKNYTKLFVPFLLILVSTIVLLLSMFGIGYFSVLSLTDFQTNIQSIFAIGIIIFIFILAISIITQMLEFSVYKPIQEIINKKKPTDWKKNFKNQFKNTIKTIIASLIIFIPLLIAIISFALSIFYYSTSTLIFAIGILITIILGLIGIALLFSSMFIEYNIVLKNMGIIESIKKSIKTVRHNIGICLVYLFFWGILSFILSFVGMIPIIGMFVNLIIQIFIIAPVSIFTYILLANKLIK
ncbi:MAG: hypothetical protein WC356_01370 [Candidatus Micrarchaeia archaeon]|jgi:MFS family permease